MQACHCPTLIWWRFRLVSRILVGSEAMQPSIWSMIRAHHVWFESASATPRSWEDVRLFSMIFHVHFSVCLRKQVRCCLLMMTVNAELQWLQRRCESLSTVRLVNLLVSVTTLVDSRTVVTASRIFMYTTVLLWGPIFDIIFSSVTCT